MTDPGKSGMYLPSAREHYLEVFQTFRAYQSAVNEVAIVSITDLKGDIVYVNQMFIDVSKYSEEELIGSNHRLINSGYHTQDFFQNMWTKIKAGKSWRGEIKNRAKDGSYYWVDTVITPIADKKGRVFQYLSIRNLITLQKENEERLIAVQKEISKRERQLRDAQKVARTGSWYLTVSENNQLEWSEETYEIFEIAKDAKLTYENFLAMVHPDDRERVHLSWQEALKSGVYHIEHRINTASGEKWVSERAHFEFDESSSLKSALGTVQDITEKRKIEDSLRISTNLYKTLFNNSPFAISIVDKETLKFLEVNDTAVKLYGYLRKEFLELNLYDIRVVEEHSKLRELLSTGNFLFNKSIRLHKKMNGEIMYVEPSVTSIDYKGRGVFLIAIKDMTAKVKVEEELRASENRRQKDIIEAEERSRSEIGMELHDNVNQLLVACRLYLERIEKSPGGNNSHLLHTAMDILRSSQEEIRKLSASLVTPIFGNSSLKESIEFLAKSYEMLNTEIEANVQINEEMLQQGLKANMYRIIQELLSNSIKHASAKRIEISLIQDQNVVDLNVADDGIGFNLKQNKKGIGLANLMHRAEAYGGNLTIDTGIDHGCKINVRFVIL